MKLKIFSALLFSSVLLFNFLLPGQVSATELDQEEFDLETISLIYSELEKSNELMQESESINDILDARAVVNLKNMKYSDYFVSSKWITRDGVISLSITPKTNSPLRKTQGNIQMGHAMRAFEIISQRHSSDRRWKNTVPMSHQFHCHVQFAGNKSAWNLEPHRTSTNYLDYVNIKNRCNP